MRVPLHLKQNDTSPKANMMRLELHMRLSALNPKGWRTPSGKAGRTKKAHRIPSRLERMARGL
jgi:hypothetical protein